jgi:hypothetical protein
VQKKKKKLLRLELTDFRVFLFFLTSWGENSVKVVALKSNTTVEAFTRPLPTTHNRQKSILTTTTQ